MASLGVVLLLFFLSSTTVEAQENPASLLYLGSSLSPSTVPWGSPSGLFAFGFYPEGNEYAVGIWIVGRPNNTVVWTANRDEPPVLSNATVDFTEDGLFLHTDQGAKRVIANVTEPAISASMLDSGNFVLYNNDSSVIWQSFDFPTDTILGDQNLTSGRDLVSSVSNSDHSSGRFLLSMQLDGNLVAYPVNSSHESDDSYWSSQTPNGDYKQLNLNNSGVLSLHSDLSDDHTLVNSSSGGESDTIIFWATLDVDGIFRLYSHKLLSNISSIVSTEWSSLQNPCDVRGYCGFNSYCSRKDGEAVCLCYPGFLFVDPSNKFMGCYRNFSEDLCRNNQDCKLVYNISPLPNLMLGDYPYTVLTMEKADCGNSCVEDGYCGGALYFDGNCRKYKLPLRYGRVDLNNTATAFFKINSETVLMPDSPSIQTVVIDEKKDLILILAVSLGFIACLCSAIAILSVFIYKHRVDRYRKLSDKADLGLFGEFTLRSFSYNELERATDAFKEELGRGSHGTVYKGTLSGGNRIVAVKRLEKVLEDGEREFRSEMTVIGRTYHRNLVRLLGFCVEGSRKLLVYEYMSNGSLADLLFKSERHLSWREKLKIALDVARGILYLHEECEACIIHCCIKPRNILLDDAWTAKISDFGMAKLVMRNQIETAIGVREERGYLAPEWQQNALISLKVDIYSYGVVLLEIICRRSNIDVSAPTADEIILSSWVYKCFVTRQLCTLDEDEEVDLKTLERMVKVSLWCVQDDPDLRPPINNIIRMLEGTIDTPVPPPPSVSLLDS